MAATTRSARKRSTAAMLRAVGITALALGAAVQHAITPAQSAAIQDPRDGQSSTSYTALLSRHGDHGHGHDEDDEDAEAAVAHGDHHSHAHNMHHHQHDDHSSSKDKDASASLPYSHFTHEHAPFTPADKLPDPWTAGPLLLPIPPPPPGVWGGHHHHGNAPALTEFNETALFYSKSAAPLSYIEWDMNWGPARTNEVRRFVAAGENETDGVQLMGAVDGRWRTLFDEPDAARRLQLNRRLKSFVEGEGEPARHLGLMVAHVVGCVLACFVLLPITLFLRAASSSLAPIAALSYLVTLFFSLLLGSLYKALSPPLFPPNAHGKMAWVLLYVSAAVFSIDVIRFLRQIVSVFTGSRAVALEEHYSPAEEEEMLKTTHSEEDAEEVIAEAVKDEGRAYESRLPRRHDSSSASSSSSRTAGDGACPSPTGTLVGTPRGSMFQPHFSHSLWGARRSASPASTDEIDAEKAMARQGGGGAEHDASSGRRRHRRGLSSISALWERDGPSADSPSGAIGSAASKTRPSRLRSIVRYTHVTVARALPILAFAVTYTGITVYTGSCRANTVNGCAAHGIKGGIFFWYGLLTFGRYMGAYAEHGWAWNARPKAGSSRVPSAEFVESFVIFLYGASNTWMERFGAKAGDPYSVKQVQHISIAVMYWFAGLVGMIIETGWTKRLLGLPIALTHPSARRPGQGGSSSRRRDASFAMTTAAAEEHHDVDERDPDAYATELMDEQRLPPSYAGSFNPFPALCVGVTGVAMAAHHQDYVYEVEVHALWGNLLAGFALLRCLTYFFLYLRPPTASILPSRPPTEALASFALTCGGLVFMLSSEEVSFLAMRSGWGDIMMVANVSVALVCLVFAGMAGLFILKAWAVRRELRRGSRQSGLVGRAGQGRRRRAGVLASSGAGAATPVFVLGEEGEEDGLHGADVDADAEEHEHGNDGGHGGASSQARRGDPASTTLTTATA